MKVLSLTQPWAALIVDGFKCLETRSWKPSPAVQEEIKQTGFFIHASVTKKYDKRSCREICYEDPFMERVGGGPGYDKLTFGAIIGHVNFIQCIPTDDLNTADIKFLEAGYFNGSAVNISNEERSFGDYSPGRYAWQLAKPTKFSRPIPATGALNLWQCHIKICKKCGCTENDCSDCIKKTGHPCHWVAPNLCSACLILP